MSRFSAPATGSQPGNACSRDRRQPTDDFVQRTQDYDKLKEHVGELAGLQAAERLQFILVHGNRGMGKTSLVKALLQDSDVLHEWGYGAHFIEIGAGAGIGSRDVAAHQAPPDDCHRRLKNKVWDATRDKSDRKVIVLDNMQPDQARNLFGIFDSSTSSRELTVVVITSRKGPNAWMREFQYSIAIGPDPTARLAMLAKYAYEDGTRSQLDDAHEVAGAEIIKDVREPHHLCLIGCALNLGLCGVSWSNILVDQGTGATNLEAIRVVAPDVSFRGSDNAQEIQETLRIHLSLKKLQVPKDQKLEWDVLLGVLGLFNWDKPLPLVALQMVWRAYVVHEGGGGYNPETQAPADPVVDGEPVYGFRDHLQALVDACVLEPVPGDMGMSASLFRLGVGVREHDLLRKLGDIRSTKGVIRDLPDTKDTKPNLVVQAFICLCFYGSDKEAALAALRQLPEVEPLPANITPWLSHFEARKLYEINIPAVLEQLLRPESHARPRKFLVQQLLVSAATGSVLVDVRTWLQELLRNISTAPLALAVVVGALQEEQGRWVHRIRWRAEHGQAIDRCCQNCLDDTGDQLEAGAAADYLRQVWKVVFLELGDYDRAHRVITVVVELCSRRGDLLRELQARRWMAATCAWKGDRKTGGILREHLMRVDHELGKLRGQQDELHQPLQNERRRTLLAISEVLVGTRSQTEARENVEALKLADSKLLQCEQPSGCATALTVQARRMKAWSWRHQGEFDKALCEFEKLREERRRIDQQHYLTLLSQAEIGIAYGDKKQHSDALKEKEVALEGLRPILGDDHPLCLKLQRSIAVTLVLLDLHDEALKSDKELRVKFISRQMLVDKLQSRHDTAVDQYLRSLHLHGPGVLVMPDGNPIQNALQEALQAASEAYKALGLAVIECGNLLGECPWQSDMELGITTMLVWVHLLYKHSGRQEQQKGAPVMMSRAASSRAASNVAVAAIIAGGGFDVAEIGSWQPRKLDLRRSLASSTVLNKRELPLFPLVAEE